MLDVQPKLLRRAAQIAGGKHALCRLLGVSDGLLCGWMEGRRKMPDSVFLHVVDLVLKDDLAWAEQDRRESPRALMGSGDEASGIGAPASKV